MLTHALPKLRSQSAGLHAGSQHHVNQARVWLHEMLCALHGHDLVLHFERARICLRCVTCGHETPGWRIK